MFHLDWLIESNFRLRVSDNLHTNSDQNSRISTSEKELPAVREITSLQPHVLTCVYVIFFPTHMVRNSVIGLERLRMRKLNTKRAVPLDAVPERRTKRCSPRFRPGDRFCEPSFRYQSSPTGIEGEISRPLDHM